MRNSRNQPKFLLIGSTGNGKTTLMDLFATLGGVFSAGRELKLRNMVKVDDPMLSKTSVTSKFECIFWGKPICIIDTPGLGDTSGIAKDKENIAQMVQAVGEEKYLNAVLLVINGKEPRLTLSCQYVLSELSRILPADFNTKIIAFVTNCGSEVECNYDLEVMEQTLSTKLNENVIYIENPLALLKNITGTTGASKLTQKQGKRRKRERQNMLNMFGIATEEIIEFFQIVSNFEIMRTYSFL